MIFLTLYFYLTENLCIFASSFQIEIHHLPLVLLMTIIVSTTHSLKTCGLEKPKLISLSTSGATLGENI